MSYNQPRRSSGVLLALRKVFASAFIVITFAAYAIHDRATAQGNQPDANSLPLPTDTGTGLSASPTAIAYVPTPTAIQAASPTNMPPTASNVPSTSTSIPISLSQPLATATNVPSST